MTMKHLFVTYCNGYGCCRLMTIKTNSLPFIAVTWVSPVSIVAAVCHCLYIFCNLLLLMLSLPNLKQPLLAHSSRDLFVPPRVFFMSLRSFCPSIKLYCSIIVPFINFQRSLILDHSCPFPSTAAYIKSPNSSRILLFLSFQSRSLGSNLLCFDFIPFNFITSTSNLCFGAYSSPGKTFTFLTNHLSQPLT